MAGERNLKLENFLVKGYFPSELIPPINSRSYASAIVEMKSSLDGMNIMIGGEKVKTSKYGSYTIPKIRHQRRVFGLPNPFFQAKLMILVVENWSSIKKHISKSKYSMTKPFLNTSLKRGINREYEYKEIFEKIATESLGYRYILRTDISRFFPTIYTHSIPWALHGKKVEKLNKGRKPNLGNKIDKGVTLLQDDQTFGIPIGSDTSYVISEIIAAKLDDEIYKELKAEAIRYTDDYYIFFKSYSEAEKGLSRLHGILADYQLEINAAKTEIFEVPHFFEEAWVNTIRKFKFSYERNQKSDLLSYFALVNNFLTEYPDQSVLKYALKRTMSTKISKRNWPLYEGLVLNSLLAESNVISVVNDILIAYKAMDYPLNNKKIGKFINTFLALHLESMHSHEISWALWIAKNLKLKISYNNAKKLVEVTDSISILIALDLREQGLVSTRPSIKGWKNLATHENLYSEHWLVAYEAVKKGWIVPSINYLKEDIFYSKLLRRGVEFYDMSEEAQPMKIGGRRIRQDFFVPLKTQYKRSVVSNLHTENRDGRMYNLKSKESHSEWLTTSGVTDIDY